jgi:site-specific recombinase XerC
MLLNRALDEELIGRNPATGIPAPETDRARVRVLKPWELEAVAANLPERWRAFVLLAAYASLRWSELVAVKRDDIDIEERTLRIDEKVVEVRGRFEWGGPKTKESARTVHLPEVAVKPLAGHLLRFPPLRGTSEQRWEGLVFYGERVGPIRRHVFRRVWDRACRAAGLESVRPEWLRHTGASLAYPASRDMKAVASRLGHTSTRMMDTVYVEVYSDVSKQLADAIDVLGPGVDEPREVLLLVVGIWTLVLELLKRRRAGKRRDEDRAAADERSRAPGRPARGRRAGRQGMALRAQAPCRLGRRRTKRAPGRDPGQGANVWVHEVRTYLEAVAAPDCVPGHQGCAVPTVERRIAALSAELGRPCATARKAGTEP